MKRDKTGNIIFSPHDLIKFMSSPFITWMDLRYLDDKSLQPDVQDESTRILQLKGLDHERQFLDARKNDGLTVCELDGDGDGFERTLDSMRMGHDVIYQAQLNHGNFSGLSDFLFRRAGESEFGPYHYDVWDTKLAKKPKPYFVIQLCCYAEMMEGIQGRMPETVGIALGGGLSKEFRTDDYLFFYRQLKKSFLDFVDNFDPSEEPCDVEVKDFSRWNTYAEKLLEERDDLSRVANIRKMQIERLKQNGITTMEALATSTCNILPKVRPETLATLKQQARLQKASAGLPRPLYEFLAQRPEQPRRGFALMPPHDKHDLYFDMEGYPHVEGGLEYLFGVTYFNENGQPDFIDWWAHDREQEKQAFEQFIDWVHARWKQHPGLHVYHYANYEVAAMRRLMGRHGTRENEVDDLLRNEVFIDLYQVVKQAMCIGEPSYSIKKVEHLYREKRAGEVSTATDSIVYYERWLEERDGVDWRTSQLLKDIRDYNKVDCDSTMELCDWLRERQRESNIDYIPKPHFDSEEPKEKKVANDARLAESARFAAELLSEVDENERLSAEQKSLQQMLAWLLLFHRRELKPIFWAMYERHGMSQDELIDDLDCLGGLARTNSAKESKVNRQYKYFLYEYEFDPRQDTKLKEGDDCFLSHDLRQRTKIESLDREHGRIVIKLQQKCEEPPSIIGLIPDELVRTDSLETAIYEIVQRWRGEGGLPPAIDDFLNKRHPRIKGMAAGEHLINEALDLTDETYRVISNLENSTLCIQGPPGCGKTTKAAKIITALIRAGKRVGVTSNSHKAIENLMEKVGKVAESSGVAVIGAKIGGPDPEFSVSTIRQLDKKKVFPNTDFNFIGATAFAFCGADAIDAVDYLFVDEAGQVSIANLVAVSRSTKNIILLGDQMQLEQPTQGSHPGNSGESTLQFYMDGHATIPKDRGIFFGTTYRMHPDLCGIVSGAVYEGRLQPDACTAKRELLLPSQKLPLISKKAGVQFVPVEHRGNTQGSAEEVECIEQLVAQLEQCQLTTENGDVRAVTLDDILIVAPYNLQVRNIQTAIPDAKVGSVDKFQGQEKPIVILSMCASEGNSSPRGLSFLFNLNRLNVALSRAETLAIVVGSPQLAYTESSTIEQMKLVNFYCRIVQTGSLQLVSA